MNTQTKATLWDRFKSELEGEADSHYRSNGVWHGDALKAAAARATLDRMLQMETLATDKAPEPDVGALTQALVNEFGAITTGFPGTTHGEYLVLDASPEEVARFILTRGNA